jgi:outer membrane protein assembly factor BamB
MSPDRQPFLIGFAVALGLAVISFGSFLVFGSGSAEESGTTLASPDTTGVGVLITTTTTEAPTTSGSGTTATTGTTGATDTTEETTTTTGPTLHAWVDRSTIGEPWGSTEGLLMFRGNPTNTWYGTGPVPETPEVMWQYPDGPMCSESTDLGVTSTWCGNGWTGQPVIWVRPDGVHELIFGAYDRRLHFVDAKTGFALREPLLTGDIIKGTPTIDPDGFPLVYFGSRDNKLRILALDRTEAVELWSVTADLTQEGRWNDDWDANPRIINDYMFEGSENSIFYIWKLNRGYDEEGKVTVDPMLIFQMNTWTQEILDLISPSGYMATSVENSAAVFEGRVYFATSAGRVIGLDIHNIDAGVIDVVFDYWVGDDVDASIVVDGAGMLYVSAEYERYTERARTLGQLVKLNPYDEDDPYVWGMFSTTEPPAKGGLWSTPALGDGVLYAITHKGFLVAVDQSTGEELWVEEVGAGSWSSPAVVDDHLVVATNPGLLRSYDIRNPREPVLEWEIQVGAGNIEATPAVWDGMIYVGVRDGYMYAVGE